MAKFIGNLTLSSTSGERRVHQLLHKTFEKVSGVYCYYEPIIGDIYPDFIILSPTFGVVIIEVKDYYADSLISVSQTENWIQMKNERKKILKNPFKQIYVYWKTLSHRIEIQNDSGEKRVRISQLIIFPKISKESIQGRTIIGFKTQKCGIFFKEDVTNYNAFQNRFSSLVPSDLNLSLKEMNILRGNIIPTCRLPHPSQTKIFSYFPLLFSGKILKVLDGDQERFANNLGEGHRLIFGVAGSGKTVLLVARARYLALRYPDWRILVICYNKLLAGQIERLIKPLDYEADIEIYNYHKWAKDFISGKGSQYFSQYNLKFDEMKASQESLDPFFRDYVPSLLNKVIDESKVDYYDAILIDEAQDFEKNWFFPLIKLLNPKTNSLLVTCDGLQGIYARKRFYWIDVGIHARGRVTKFEKTYRNPATIGKLAFQFLMKDLDLLELIEKEDEFLSTKEFIRKGGSADVKVFSTRKEEHNFIIKVLETLQRRGGATLLLSPRKIEETMFKHPLTELMDKSSIEWHYLKKTGLEEKGIYVGTLQGTKGLEADTVIIPEIDKIKFNGYNRQLLYVGMTRALQSILLTASGENKFTTELTNLLEQYKGSKRDSQKTYDITQIRKKYPKAYVKWTEEEENQLISDFTNNNLTINELSKKFQRQPGGIRSRLRKLGLIE